MGPRDELEDRSVTPRPFCPVCDNQSLQHVHDDGGIALPVLACPNCEYRYDPT